MIDYQKWSGIKFEWDGICIMPWEKDGCDCFVLTDRFRIAIGMKPIPAHWHIGATYSYGRKTLPATYIEDCFTSQFLSQVPNETFRPTAFHDNECIALYHSQYGVAMAAVYNGQCLVFGSDLRSHWEPVGNLPIKSFWKLTNATI